MSLSDYKRLELSSEEDRRVLRQEELIIEVTEAIAEAMERAGITQKELSQRMNCTKGYVSQLLGGGRNLTLRTLSDLAVALEAVVEVELKPQIAVQAEQMDGVAWCGNDDCWRPDDEPLLLEETYGVAA